MLGGQGADFLRRAAFWSIGSLALLRWFCVTGAALRMTWHHFFLAGAVLSTGGLENRKTHWHEAVSSTLKFPFLKDVSQNSSVFDVVKFANWRSLAELFVLDVVEFKNWRSLAELLRFWCCLLRNMRRSRRIASFLMLSSANIEEVSPNCCVFNVVNFAKRRSLAE